MSAGDLGMPIGADRLQEQVVSARDVRAAERPTAEKTKVQATEVSFYYGNTKALANINLSIQAHRVTALIGPSGCGKSTFLRCLNRMYEVLKKTKLAGEIRLDGEEIREIDVTVLRQRVGMVFQKPTPFRKSIFDNVAFGPRSWGLTRRRILVEKVEHSLKRAALGGSERPP
jgi:phosphate transport system ATP-binding protein